MDTCQLVVHAEHLWTPVSSWWTSMDTCQFMRNIYGHLSVGGSWWKSMDTCKLVVTSCSRWTSMNTCQLVVYHERVIWKHCMSSMCQLYIERTILSCLYSMVKTDHVTFSLVLYLVFLLAVPIWQLFTWKRNIKSLVQLISSV